MLLAVVAGALAGIGMGYVLQRGQLRFHAMFSGAWHGGFLLGAGGWIVGGCNLGHGLSGMAQLNISIVRSADHS